MNSRWWVHQQKHVSSRSISHSHSQYPSHFHFFFCRACMLPYLPYASSSATENAAPLSYSARIALCGCVGKAQMLWCDHCCLHTRYSYSSTPHSTTCMPLRTKDCTFSREHVTLFCAMLPSVCGSTAKQTHTTLSTANKHVSKTWQQRWSAGWIWFEALELRINSRKTQLTPLSCADVQDLKCGYSQATTRDGREYRLRLQLFYVCSAEYQHFLQRHTRSAHRDDASGASLQLSLLHTSCTVP